MTTSADNWNLFQVPFVENSTSSYEYVETREQSNVTPITNRKLTFRMNNVDQYVLPNQAFLEVKLRMWRKNINEDNEGDPVTLENSAPIFSEATYKVNGKIIEHIEHLHKKILVSNLLEYSDDYARSSATDQFWFPDTGTTGDADTVLNTVDTPQGVTFATVLAGDLAPLRVAQGTNAVIVTGGNVAQAAELAFTTELTAGDFSGTPSETYNDGFKKRLALTSNSKLVVLRIPLARIFGYCKSVQLVSTGVQHEIELYTNDKENIFHAKSGAPMNDADNYPKLDIQKASIWFPHLKPSLSTAVAIEKMLSQGGSQILPFEYTNVYKLTGQTSSDVNWLFKSATERPTKVVFFFQREIVADPGAYLFTNKSKMDHLSLTRTSLTIQGTKVPEYDFESVFGDSDYTRLYNELMRVSDKHPMDYNTGMQISYKSFGELYPMICFDLRQSAEKLFTPGVASDMTFRAKITSPGAEDTYTDKYSIYAVLYSERVMRLDVLNRSTFLDVQ